MNSDLKVLSVIANNFKEAVLQEDVDLASDLVYALIFSDRTAAGDSCVQTGMKKEQVLGRRVRERLLSGLNYLQGGNHTTATTIAFQICCDLAQFGSLEPSLTTAPNYVM